MFNLVVVFISGAENLNESAESYKKIIEWLTILHQERTHIYYSFALILRFSFLIMISVSLTLIVVKYTLFAFMFMVAGILMLFINGIFRRKVKKSRESLILIKGILNVLIKQNGKKNEKVA